MSEDDEVLECAPAEDQDGCALELRGNTLILDGVPLQVLGEA